MTGISYLLIPHLNPVSLNPGTYSMANVFPLHIRLRLGANAGEIPWLTLNCSCFVALTYVICCPKDG